MSTLTIPWIGARVAEELGVIGRAPEELLDFPKLPVADDHFVVGDDKQGTLWTTRACFLAGDAARVFVQVVFHRPSNHVVGMVHGGASSSIIDAFAAACGVVRLDFDMRAVTKEQTIRFRRPLAIETPYLLIARAERADVVDGREALVKCALLDEEGTARLESTTTMVVPR